MVARDLSETEVHILREVAWGRNVSNPAWTHAWDLQPLIQQGFLYRTFRGTRLVLTNYGYKQLAMKTQNIPKFEDVPQADLNA